jgi:hypothetical protein
MRRFPIVGVLLVVLLLMTLVVAGCSGFGNSKQGKCSQGDSCRYYTGNRGIIMNLYQPPTIFYYRSSDLNGQADGNTAEFNVKLINDGASDSYGAVFISGFSGDMFRVYKIDSANPQGRQIIINKNRNSCYFDIMSVGRSIGNWNFLTGCLDSSINRFGGSTTLNIGAQTFEKIFGGQSWFQKYGLSNLQISMNDKGQLLSFGVGGNIADFSVMGYGRALMLIVSSLDFEGLGGSIINMKGDNADFPGGDIDYKTFKVQMISRWPAGQDYFNLPYQIKSCYSYTTFVSPMICVDPNPFSAEKKVCTSQGYAWGGSQGAPVAVTSVLQTNTGKEVLLDITIKNVGPGRVWDVGYLEACSPYYPGSVKPTMLDTVYIGFAYIGNAQLDCTNFYKVRLDPKTQTAKVMCRYDIRSADDIGSAYATPLKMELWYGYEETISSQVMIRRLN